MLSATAAGHPNAGDGAATPGDARDGRVARSERDAGFAGAHGAEQNRLLAALPLEEYMYLLPRLTSVRLHPRDVLVEPDTPMRDVSFVREGVCIVLASGLDRGDLEVGTIGCEGLVGLPVLNGADRMPFRVLVQIAGDAWRLSADAFRRLVDERVVVRKLLLRYSQYFTDQVSQHAACNQLHTVEERAARWLLMTHDRVQHDTFELTHEFLSLMLGVRRAGVSVAMSTLQAAGVLRYVRGRVEVLDRPGLEDASCDCYRVTRTALARLFG